MNTAKKHYEALLGGVYSWFVSAHGDPLERASAWLTRHELMSGERYLDLGAGFGAHTVPLARAGKHVTAVDFDATLLAELRAATRAQAQHVVVHEAELGAFLRDAPSSAFDVVLCLGDTLTHLASPHEVAALLREAARVLAPGGRLALSYRDSTGFAAEGTARFIEVARDARRTMHCLLEPLDAEHLRVTDIVTDVTPDGPRTRLGDYVKLRLAPERISAWAAAARLGESRRASENGMLTLVFTKG